MRKKNRTLIKLFLVFDHLYMTALVGVNFSTHEINEFLRSQYENIAY